MSEFIFMENQRNTTVHYVAYYNSPLGTITMAAGEKGLIGLWFEGQKYYGRGLSDNPRQAETPMIRQTRRWLDLYFAGQPTDFTPPLHLTGSDFQLAVWHELLTIAAGQTATYRQIAMSIARRKGVRSMSAQAVGNAVGRNPISIIIPCHRILGTDGSLRGYAGGLERKEWLLRHEGIALPLAPRE